jgi:hypothetical protein
MSEISLDVGGFRQSLTLRLEPNSVQGWDLAGQPALRLQLQVQLLLGGEHADVQYTVLRLSGTLRNSRLGEFATFELGPLALIPNPTPFFRSCDATVVLDRQRIRRFEDARSGDNAYFQITPSALVWYPAENKFEVPVSHAYLDVLIPKSHWVENVVSRWNLSSVKIIEIEFPTNAVGENFRMAYARVEEAESLFANGQYKQTMTSLRLSFEALAISLGFEKRVRDCFESLFASSHPEKGEKAREALTGLYKFLHLGPHEQAEQPGTSVQPVVLRRDARFALTMAYVVFEYITSQD